MPVNDYLPFATGTGASVLSQANYLALAARGTGFVQGIADEFQVNKVLRQSSVMTAALAQFASDNTGTDVLDDGNVAALEAKLARAIANSTNITLFGSGGYRTRLTADLNLYVATTGNDANNGTSPTTPLATLQGAWNTVFSLYDLNGHNVTINVANGSYSQGVLCVGMPPGCSSTNPVTGNPVNCITFLGNTTNPAAVVINVTNGNCFSCQGGAQIRVLGFQLQASGVSSGNYQNSGSALYAFAFGGIIYGNIIFAVCTAHVYSSNLGFISSAGNPYTISGGAQWHLFSGQLGLLVLAASPVTVVNTPAFTAAFASSSTNSEINANGATFSGSATGPRYVISANGIILTNGGGPNFFPGSSAGNTTTGYF